MFRAAIKLGPAFRFQLVADYVFFFAFPFLMIEGDRLYWRCNQLKKWCQEPFSEEKSIFF